MKKPVWIIAEVREKRILFWKWHEYRPSGQSFWIRLGGTASGNRIPVFTRKCDADLYKTSMSTGKYYVVVKSETDGRGKQYKGKMTYPRVRLVELV